MAQTPAFLTFRDIAKRADVSVEAVRHWARRGKLPVAFITSGGQYFFEPDVVARFLAKRLELTAPDDESSNAA